MSARGARFGCATEAICCLLNFLGFVGRASDRKACDAPLLDALQRGSPPRKPTNLVLGIEVHDRAHGVARRFDGGEDLAIDREGVESLGEEAVALIGRDDDAQWFAVDL